MDLRDYFWWCISGTTWDVSNLLQGCKWCNKTPTLCDRYPGFSEPVTTNHISHFSRQHFRTVLPMWLASLVVILWRIDWNPSRLGCNAQQKSEKSEVLKVKLLNPRWKSIARWSVTVFPNCSHTNECDDWGLHHTGQCVLLQEDGHLIQLIGSSGKL